MAKILCSIIEVESDKETGNTYAFPATDIMMSDKTTTVEDAINAKPGEVVTTDNKVGEIFNDYSNNIASGQCSHAEGIGTEASGNGAHAEGFNSTASAPYSHAEGNTTASGYSSHAEGWATTASKDYSHAEGNKTTASGIGSHAEGNNTLASSNYQHVQGQWNIEDTAGAYAHIVGWGTSSSARKNIHTIDTSGNAVFSGKVTVQDTTPTASGDLTTKSYVDSKITDTKVTNTPNATTKAYLTGTTSATTNTGTQIFDTGVYLDTVAGRLGVGSLSIGGAVVTYDSSSQTISI